MGAPSSQPRSLGPSSNKTQGRRDGSTPDEPFAWASREFLRKLAIGRECTFRVDSTSESSGRAFGTVFVGGEDAALKVAAAGFARVKPSASSAASGSSSSSSSATYRDELVAASAAAEAAGKGVCARPPASAAGGAGAAAPAIVTVAAADARP